MPGTDCCLVNKHKACQLSVKFLVCSDDAVEEQMEQLQAPDATPEALLYALKDLLCYSSISYDLLKQTQVCWDACPWVPFATRCKVVVLCMKGAAFLDILNCKPRASQASTCWLRIVLVCVLHRVTTADFVNCTVLEVS